MVFKTTDMGSIPIPSAYIQIINSYMRVKNISEIELKRVVKKLNLIIPAQTAKLGPPVGPVLGQVKIKVKDFCTMFNDATSIFAPGLPLPVTVCVFKNETFNFFIKTPSTSFLLKNTLIAKKSKSLTLLDIYKISLIKKLDFEHLSQKSVFKSILVGAKILKITINEN
jgi:large subunit ribosomal protein L11